MPACVIFYVQLFIGFFLLLCNEWSNGWLKLFWCYQRFSCSHSFNTSFNRDCLLTLLVSLAHRIFMVSIIILNYKLNCNLFYWQFYVKLMIATYTNRIFVHQNVIVNVIINRPNELIDFIIFMIFFLNFVYYSYTKQIN